jgi:hypothetical protein
MEPRRFDAYFLAKTFTSAYAFCYIAAPLSGLHLPFMGVTLSHAILIAVGVGLIMAINVNNTPFIIFMAAFEALGCVVHFFEVLPWVPQLTTNGYLLMSMLDLTQCILLFVILEYKQLEKTRPLERATISIS